ncbi:DUF305 domain-containing protein [Micromonospora cathayae]|uniref:DUF305 domain-containing protein n=1 Tax=Micromonospora cathayae TaxID=3028804 RepID=A0ABY7ZUS4_9ACTN|nr:DUF305 domain-containing protein [Micromonospora sp. HUAS 3]WDZ86762.1 DUF305 domain-containing protein [Micromonospora sp. HUAS 3]
MAPRLRPIVLVELVVLVVFAVGVTVALGLSDDDPAPQARATATPEPPAPVDQPGVPDSTAPVVLPGRPGESARTVPADKITPAPSPSYNDADVRFVTMMIPHHEQALVMARLANGRAENPKIVAIADRILAAQAPEIQMMEGWLATRGLDRNTGDGHRHEMTGMQSADALRALENARGAAFDRMFVDMMTAHHRGAITMAEEAIALGVDAIVNETASSVGFEQAIEIERMREALAG